MLNIRFQLSQPLFWRSSPWVVWRSSPWLGVLPHKDLNETLDLAFCHSKI